MATQIDVVEINNDEVEINNKDEVDINNNNNNDEVEINNNDEVEINNNNNDEVEINNNEEVEINNNNNDEVKINKPKRRNRPELKEKTSCPDCGKELTMHGLKYTHKKYCKGKSVETAPISPPMPKLERMVTAHENKIMKDIEDSCEVAMPPTSYVPSEDQISAYLLAQKKIRVNKKREQMSRLVSKALPQ